MTTFTGATIQKKETRRKRKWPYWLAFGIVVLAMLSIGVYSGIKAIINSGITKGPDHLFGDQHLKTSLALIELHKIRYGQYPDSLKDIKYIGQWDSIHLSSVYYIQSADRQSYYIEVSRGWIGKPDDFKLPDDFWQGTGYNPQLKETGK